MCHVLRIEKIVLLIISYAFFKKREASIYAVIYNREMYMMKTNKKKSYVALTLRIWKALACIYM